MHVYIIHVYLFLFRDEIEYGSSIPVPLIRKIGREITANLEELADQLGMSNAELSNYKKMNYRDGKVTSEGTVQMLLDWRERVAPRDQRKTLRDALKNSGLIRIQAEYLPTASMAEVSDE